MDQLDAICGIDQNVLWSKIAVHNSVIVDVLQRLADGDGDSYRSLLRDLATGHDFPKASTFQPFQHKIRLASMPLRHDFNDPGVIQTFSNFLLALKSLGEGGIGFQFRMRQFDGDWSIRPQIDCVKDRIGIGSSHDPIKTVMIKLIAEAERMSGRGRHL
jgi:hypothetical protein